MRNISDFQKTKDYLICVDSDGCAMDTADSFRGSDPIDSFCGLWDTRI